MKLSEFEIEHIHNAAKILTENLKFKISIRELASKVGLNERKIKEGFKQEYNTGVFSYQMNVRMDKAKELLLKSFPLTYIARSIGYQGNNAESNFIRAFKNLYGETPGVWAKNNMKNKVSRMVV